MEKIELNFIPIVPEMLNIVPSGGGSILSGGVFQSPNYVAGSSGWKLDADGSIECLKLIVRGLSSLGKWNVNATSIYTGTEDHSGYTANAGDMTFYSDGSDASIHAKNFYIDTSGNLNCAAGTITGATIKTATADERIYLTSNYLRSYISGAADANYSLEITTEYINFYDIISSTQTIQTKLESDTDNFYIRRYDDNGDASETFFFTDNSFYSSATGGGTTLGTSAKNWLSGYIDTIISSPAAGNPSFKLTNVTHSSPANGDLWYDAGAGKLRFRDATTTYDIDMTAI